MKAAQSYSWRAVGVDSSAPKIKNHTATHVGDGRIFFFGGYDGAKNHSALHIFHSESKTWDVNKECTGDRPPGRNGHTATLEGGYIYIIGGWLGQGPLAAGDMYRLHVRSLTWERLHFPDGKSPGPCNMHTADLMPGRRIVVFRGGDGHEYLNDIHIFDIETMVWSHPSVSGDAPTRRANHASAVYGNHLFILGGWDGSRRLNDIHVLHVETLRWDRLNAGGGAPSPRAGMSLTGNGERLLLFGGSGPHSQCFNDLQVLDVDLSLSLCAAGGDSRGGSSSSSSSSSSSGSTSSGGCEGTYDTEGWSRRNPIVQWLHTKCVNSSARSASPGSSLGNPGEAPPGGGGGRLAYTNIDEFGLAGVKQHHHIRPSTATAVPFDAAGRESARHAALETDVRMLESESDDSIEGGSSGTRRGRGEETPVASTGRSHTVGHSGMASHTRSSPGRVAAHGDVPNPMEEGARSAHRSSEVRICGSGPGQRAG